jgi:predicted AAA+ superfamily ATPase
MVKFRYIEDSLKSLCFSDHKMAFISGPRQCGKTTLAKRLLKERECGEYCNWDEKSFRKSWTKDPLAALTFAFPSDIYPLVILDEIHKAKGWKRDLKGVYDSLDQSVDIVVTGSAKLDVYRRGGDSLLGRYHSFRLHPFSLAEIDEESPNISHEELLEHLFGMKFDTKKVSRENLEALFEFGPFPEPLFSKNKNKLRLWQRERVERLIREDLRDLSRIQELSQIEMLVSLLPDRTANPLSINALREDLEVAYATMKLWMSYLKQIYYCYEIKPYSKNIPRSLKKEGKLYLWDWSEVENDGARFENLIAGHLLKYAHYLTDTGEANVDLCYLKNKEKKEIDFLLVKDKQPWLPVEVKLNDDSLSENWSNFLKDLPCKKGVQVTYKPNVCKLMSHPHGEVLVLSAEYFLALLV